MRTLAYEDIVQAISALCEETLFGLRDDIVQALEQARHKEQGFGRIAIELILQNALFARRDKLPLSQENGIPFFFVEMGYEVEIEGGTLSQAVEEGVRNIQNRFPFETCALQEPFSPHAECRPQANSLLQWRMKEGDELKINCLRFDAKAEQSTQIHYVPASINSLELKSTILEIVRKQAIVSSSPFVIGIGLGSTASGVVQLAQKALLRPVGKPHQELDYARVEHDLLHEINALNFGPGGFGGHTTALAVHIEVAPTYPSRIPLCVYLQSHTLRNAEISL